MAKSNAGRPTVMTKEALRKLEEAFLVGATDLEACCNANIGSTSLYEYCKLNPEFAERKETLKNQPVLKAKIIVDKALNDDDLNTAHRVIDRKEGTKVKQEVSGPDGKPVEVSTFNFIPVGSSK